MNLSDIPPSLFVEIFTSLSSCVSQLRLGCHFESLPISLPELMAKLHDQCPVLECLMIESIDLVKNLHTVPEHPTRRSKILSNRLLCDAKVFLEDPFIQMIESHFSNEEDMELLNAVLPKLRILSFRQVLFSEFHILSLFSKNILPEIVVLDLSYSKPLSMGKTKIGLFYTLVNLEELYLAGWKITDINLVYFFRSVKKLRVLDLEDSRVTGKTISVLKKHCGALEELYLGYCRDIREIPRNNEDKQLFPNLKALCMKGTCVTPRGVEGLAAACPSLKFVNVSNCKNFNKLVCRKLFKDFKGKVNFCCDEINFPCNHFIRTEYSNF